MVIVVINFMFLGSHKIRTRVNPRGRVKGPVGVDHLSFVYL